MLSTAQELLLWGVRRRVGRRQNLGTGYIGSDLGPTQFLLPCSAPELNLPSVKVSSQDLGKRAEV